MGGLVARHTNRQGSASYRPLPERIASHCGCPLPIVLYDDPPNFPGILACWQTEFFPTLPTATVGLWGEVILFSRKEILGAIDGPGTHHRRTIGRLRLTTGAQYFAEQHPTRPLVIVPGLPHQYDR